MENIAATGTIAHYIHLPPERHVIEVVQPPSSGNFIINGTRFTAKTAACCPGPRASGSG